MNLSPELVKTIVANLRLQETTQVPARHLDSGLRRTIADGIFDIGEKLCFSSAAAFLALTLFERVDVSLDDTHSAALACFILAVAVEDPSEVVPTMEVYTIAAHQGPWALTPNIKHVLDWQARVLKQL